MIPVSRLHYLEGLASPDPCNRHTASSEGLKTIQLQPASLLKT